MPEVIVNFIEKTEIQKRLTELNGSKVAVWTGVGNHNSFDTQISVAGKLFIHPQQTEKLRVVVNPQTYVYFKIEDVVLITPPLSEGFTERDNCEETIRIRVDSPKFDAE